MHILIIIINKYIFSEKLPMSEIKITIKIHDTTNQLFMKMVLGVIICKRLRA